jgi:hypothetical protein
MVKKSRLGLYLESDDVKKMVKIAAAKHGVSVTAYCARAIEERLHKDGEITKYNDRKALLARMDKIRKEIGPLGIITKKLIETGRHH